MPSNFSCARRRGIVLLILTGLLVAWNPSLLAQTAGTGALTGTVTDPSGAVVPNATVTATSLDTGQARMATTGADGTYSISLLPPGNYRVRFEAAGFKPVEIPSATVTVTETAVLSRALEVGAQEQTVTVASEVETIQTASSALGTVATARTVTELPLSTRNYTNLLAMSSGANASVQDASLLGKGTTLIAVNGAGTAQNTFLQDGVVINNWFSFNTGVEGVSVGGFAIPNPDAISEFKIQTSTYDAGYGRNPGANVNVVTKSGTNDFHGNAFEFFRNTALNANTWFRNFNGLPKPELNSNQYGGVFGGPIKKNKLFFFVSYEETDQKNGLTGYGAATALAAPIPTGNRGTCPTGWTSLSQCDAASQTFVPALAAAVSPQAPCSRTAANDTTSNGGIQVQCPTGTVTDPLYNLNPVAISMLQLKNSDGTYLIPSSGVSPNGPGGGYAIQNYSIPAVFKDHNGMGNFDYVINSKNTLSGRYEYERDPLYAPFPVQNALQQGNFVPGNPIETIKWNQSAILRLTTIVSNNLVNEVHVAYQRYPIQNEILTPFTNSQVGVTDLRAGIDYLSGFSIGSSSGGGITGGMSWGGQYQFGGIWVEDQLQAGDQISWTHGKHTVRAGYEFVRVNDVPNNYGSPVGNPSFARWADFFIGRSACNFTGCSATNPGNTNGTTSSSITNGDGGTLTTGTTIPYDWYINDSDAFVQDDFKVNSRLTLNIGVRWEYDGWPTEKNGYFTNIWPSLINTAANPGSGCVINGAVFGAGAAGTGCSLAGFVAPANYKGVLPQGIYQNSIDNVTETHAPYDDFAPRIGFAWQPTSNNHLVVRGGAGYFYEMMPGNNTANQGTPLQGAPVITGLTTGNLQDPWQFAPTIPGPSGSYGFTPRWLNITSLSPLKFTYSAINQAPNQQNLTVPVTYEWNLNTQYEFARDWVLEVGYVGSHGIWQGAQSRSGQQGQFTAINFNIAPLAGTGCTSCALTGVTTSTPANAALRVPYLGITPTATEVANADNYKYNSLQATVRKQLSYGLQLQGSYTWSRSFIQAPYGTNVYPYEIQQYEPNDNYRPQRFVLSYVWNLPLGHHTRILDRVTDGWSWSGVFTLQDGFPITVTDGRAGSVFCGGGGCNGGGLTGTANYCPGMTGANVLSSGSIESRVTSGLTGGPGYFNAGVFCAPPVVTGAGNSGTLFGNTAGGIVLGPGQNNWDMSLAKLISIREAQSLQFRAEFFNTFNKPQFSLPSASVNGGSLGEITATSVSPRIIQLALKYSF
jgi:Carboxypeptidase regulatory-like domain